MAYKKIGYRRKIDDAAFIALIKSGKRTKEISIELGVSHQGVRARAVSLGVLEDLRANKPVRAERLKISARWGLPMPEVRRLWTLGATAAFTRQRINANRRGIPWELTFVEWWEIWERSGKWDFRGKTKGGYVMGRPGDSGPYSVGNVVICTHSENALVAQSHARRYAGQSGCKITKAERDSARSSI